MEVSLSCRSNHMFMRVNQRVLDIGFLNAGGGSIALRTRLFKSTKPAYPCQVYAKGQETWLDLNTRTDVSASNVDDVWWLAKSTRSAIQIK